MRLFFRRALAALALLCCCNAFAAPYPTADELRAAIGVAAVLANNEGLALEMKDARVAGVTLPLMAASLNLTHATCQVFYNPKPEGGLKPFFDAMQDADLPLWLGAIAVHEIAHCVEQREVYVHRRFDKVLPPGFRRDGMTAQGYLGVVKSGAIERWGEALADIASVLYLKQAVPDRWKRLAQDIVTMRRGFAARWPSHDTSPWLVQLLVASDQPPAPESLFDTAFRLRRQFSTQ